MPDMEFVSAETRKEGSHIIAVAIKDVSPEDFAALLSGAGHLEVVLYCGADKVAIAARAELKDADGKKLSDAKAFFDASKA